MDLFSKAKDVLKGGGDSNKRGGKKDFDLVLNKAIDVIEKYHVKEKAVEFAQQQVSKREKHQGGHVKTKDKSIVDKVKEAAEDFLVKQGQEPLMRSSWNSNTGHIPSESSRNHFVKYETYEEYWSRRSNQSNKTPTPSNYTCASPYAFNGRYEPASAPLYPPCV